MGFASAKPSTERLPASPVSHEEPCLFRALKIKSFALALPWQSLPSQSYQDHLPASLVSQPSLAFFAPSESWALLQQSLPYIGKLSTRKAYHEYLPTFRALKYRGFASAKLSTNAFFPSRPCLFRALKIVGFASAKPSTERLPASPVSHVKPCLFRALKIVGFASAKPSTERLPASPVSHVKPCLFRALKIDGFASAKPTTT